MYTQNHIKMKKFKTSITYGLIISLAGSLLMISLIEFNLLGPKAISLDNQMIGGTILFLILYIFLLFGIYFSIKKRKDQNGQKINFKEALFQGIVVSLSTAIFSVVLTFLFYEIIYQNYATETLEALKIKMENANVPIEKLNLKLSEKSDYYSTPIQIFYSFKGNCITGIAFTLLLSFFLKSTS